jgi:hypothetical protein
MPACSSRHKSRSHTRAARASCSSPIARLSRDVAARPGCCTRWATPAGPNRRDRGVAKAIVRRCAIGTLEAIVPMFLMVVLVEVEQRVGKPALRARSTGWVHTLPPPSLETRADPRSCVHNRGIVLIDALRCRGRGVNRHSQRDRRDACHVGLAAFAAMGVPGLANRHHWMGYSGR